MPKRKFRNWVWRTCQSRKEGNTTMPLPEGWIDPRDSKRDSLKSTKLVRETPNNALRWWKHSWSTRIWFLFAVCALLWVHFPGNHVPHYLDLSQEGPWGWGKLRSVLPSASAFPLHVVTAWVCVEPGKPKPKRIKYMRNYLFLRSRTSGVSRMPARYSSNLTFWLLILMKTEAVVHFSCNFLYFFLYMCHILYHAS